MTVFKKLNGLISIWWQFVLIVIETFFTNKNNYKKLLKLDKKLKAIELKLERLNEE